MTACSGQDSATDGWKKLSYGANKVELFMEKLAFVTKRLGLLALTCCLVTAGLASLALWSWVARVGDVFTPIGQVPMAPSTAVLVGLLSAAVMLVGRWPRHPVVVWFGFATTAVVLLAGLLASTGFWWEHASRAEELLAPTIGSFGAFPAGKMSPLTGVAFLLVGTALLLHLNSGGRRLSSRWFSVALSLATLMMAGAVAISYASSKPLFYLNPLIPMALQTALAFILLSAALLGITLAPEGFRSFQPGDPILAIWAISGLIALGVAIVGAVYMRQEQSRLRANGGQNLEVIADLKSSLIANWRQERIIDARLFSRTSSVPRQVEQFLANPKLEQARLETRLWLSALLQGGTYLSVELLDANRSRQLGFPEDITSGAPKLYGPIEEALTTNQIVLTDLHRNGQSDEIHMDLVCPLSAVMFEGARPSSTGPSVPRAFLILRVAPKQWLYPVIDAWPAASRTAETLLLRREGKEMICLNEPPRGTNSALNLRLPSEGILRRRGTKAMPSPGDDLEGIDYRGQPVLAALRSVPDSPWFIVTKMDRSEMYWTPAETSPADSCVDGIHGRKCRPARLGFLTARGDRPRSKGIGCGTRTPVIDGAHPALNEVHQRPYHPGRPARQDCRSQRPRGRGLRLLVDRIADNDGARLADARCARANAS